MEGDWRLNWQKDHVGRWKLSRLKVLSTSRGRSVRDAFTEVTQRALGKNSSYRQQLLLGVEYWQGILDYVAGMDIYGHNGVSIADIDDDGDEDFHVSQPAGLPNLLFRNPGRRHLSDVTEKAGVDVLDNTSASFFADVDNDGDPDLILVGTRSLLFHNDGSGRFSLVSDSGFEAIDDTQGGKVSAAVADYDLDDIWTFISAHTPSGRGRKNWAIIPFHTMTPTMALPTSSCGTGERVVPRRHPAIRNEPE